VALRDPFPQVSGGGLKQLAVAGIDVELGLHEEEARELNAPYLKLLATCRPWIIAKWAMTLDGKIAAFDRRARWITGPAAREQAHRLRSVSDAVVVGIGTALADDPALDVRLSAPWPREPLRVVVDSRARLPVTARLIGAGNPARAVVAVADAAPADRVAALVSRGATVLACKSERGRVDVTDLAARLLAMDVMAVLVEGGGELHASFVEAKLVDRVAVFIAPKLIGGAAAPTAVGGRGLELPEALRLDSPSLRSVGDDWLIEGDVRSTDGEG